MKTWRFRSIFFLSAALVPAFLCCFPPPLEGAIVKRALPPSGCEEMAFSLPDVSGKIINAEDFREQVTLFAFCACFADTCCTIMNALDKLAEEYGQRGLSIVVVCAEIPPAPESGSGHSVSDLCGKSHLIVTDDEREVRGRYKVRQLPTTFLTGEDSCISERISGVTGLYSSPFRQAIEELLPEE